jgi:hypothetical protein
VRKSERHATLRELAVNPLSDGPTARQEENAAVTDATTTPPVEGASERLEARAGSIQILRGGDGPPLLFLHAAGGAGTWLPSTASWRVASR